MDEPLSLAVARQGDPSLPHSHGPQTSSSSRAHLVGPSLLGAEDAAIALHCTRIFMATAPGNMRLAIKIIYWRDVDKALLIANSKLK